jgi:CRISPR-associated Csx14 family protein
VTGIYYALQEEGVEIDAVALLATAMEKVRQSARIVQDELGHDRVVLLPLRTPNREAHTVDFDNEDAAVDFLRLANAVLIEARDRGDRVSLGISGGRSSMGALAALSAYVYGAEGIYHLWVHEDIEKQGDVDDLPVFDRDRYLNPPKELRRLVRLRLETFDDQLQPERIADFGSRHPTLARAVTDLDMDKYQKLKSNFNAGRIGMPRDLYRALRLTLLDCCSALDSDRELRSFFVTSPLDGWRHELPEAGNRTQRVDILIDFLWSRQDNSGEPLLLTFLRAMLERLPDQSVCALDISILLEDFGGLLSSQDRSRPVSEEDLTARIKSIWLM